MTAGLVFVVGLAAFAAGPGAAFAQPAGQAIYEGPEREFLQGLRDRRMGDVALIELDRIAADPSAPADLKTILPYERALTQLSVARTGGAGVDARSRLDQAEQLLKDFVLNNPSNALAGDAQFLQAEILQQKASDLLGSGDPVELPEQTRTDARRVLENAERVYTDAIAKLTRTRDEIGAYVDQADDDAVARRNSVEARLIRARVEAARVVFRQAQTYPIGSSEREELLNQADAPLDDLYADYRRKVGAFPGRIIQGQIRMARVPDDPDAIDDLSDAERTEAKQQLTKAESLLAEVVNQAPPSSAGIAVRDAVERLRGTAQRLRLSVLNHPLKADYAAVINQATQWMNADRARGGTDEGAAVIYQRGIAHEQSAPDEDGRERTRALRAALDDYQTAARRSDMVRGPATLAADRVRGKLGLDRAEPRNFADAFDAAQPLIRQLSEKQAALATAKQSGDEAAIAEAQDDLDALLAQIRPLLNAANDFADENTDPGELSRTRYLLAYVNVLTGRYYEAAILAEFVARNFQPAQPDPDDENAPDYSNIPLEAASTAALAWTQAFQNRPSETDGSFELSQLGQIADWISTNYPNSDRAGKARVTLGRVLLRDGQLVDAAAAFASVPESDPDYAEAQLQAGDALWRRSVEIANMDAPPPGESAEDFKQQAKQRLETGVTQAEKALGNAEPSAQLLIGKVTLAQIYNGEGEFDKALAQLTGGKADVQAEIAVAQGETRPERGVKSAVFAKLVYQQLLRTQIGLGDTDAAQDTIADIQAVSDSGNIGLFRSLGEQIQDELEAMPPGQKRDDARANLVGFLEKIAGSDDQTFGSLVWIAETYAGLADSLPSDDPQANTYYDAAAAALNDALDGYLPDGDGRAGAEAAIRLRLAQVQAGAGDFQAGYDQVKQVLTSKPNALNVQTAAADLLADWGEADNDAAKLVQSLVGDEAAGVWGWGKLSKMLAGQLNGPNAEQFFPEYHAARLRIPRVRAALAETKSGTERAEEYQKAERELLSWITLSDPEKIPAETRRKAEELYLELQTERGVADPQPLPLDDAPAATPSGDGDAPQVAAADAPAGDAGTPDAADAEADDGPNLVLLIAGLVLMSLLTAGAIFAFRPKKRKRAARRTTKSSGGDAATHAKMKGHGVVRSSLPEIAPIPAAAPAVPDAGPTGTGFPDFSALPQKKSSQPAAGTAPRTRSGSGSSGKRRSSSGSSSGSSSSGRTRRSSSDAAADGKKVRRRSSSSGSSSSGSSSSGSSSSGSSDTPRKRRPKPPTE